jgi:FkbM family methyltransferase
MLSNLLAPWYLLRPRRILRRIGVALYPPSPGYQELETCWGATIRADATKTIGWSILIAGIYDLCMSEVMYRLINPGDTVFDVGANVGYVTVLAAVAAGPSGRVLSFEPHPELFAVLEQNVSAGRGGRSMAMTELHRAALGQDSGTAELWIPPQFAANDGISRIVANPSPGAMTIRVDVRTIDEVLGDRSVAVLKLDVEGSELQVLRGATRALESRRIRHIIFEEYKTNGSDVVRMLEDLGFHVFSIGRSLRGPVVAPVDVGNLVSALEPPNFIGSIEADIVLENCRPRGWRVLSECP